MTVRVGASAALITYRGDVLVGFHEKTQTWGLPGGKVDYGEHPADAAVRELEEEAGIAVADLRTGQTTDPVTPHHHPRWVTAAVYNDVSWVTLIYRVQIPSRLEAKVIEPEKMSRWEWVPFLDLLGSRDLFAPLAAVFMPDLVHIGHSVVAHDAV